MSVLHVDRSPSSSLKRCVGLAMHQRLAAEGKGGAGMRQYANYSTWYNGSIRTVGYYHNQIGMLTEMKEISGNLIVHPIFTGSAGMGLAEQTGIPFIQEIVAQSEAVRKSRPDCRMLIDIGGEVKNIFCPSAKPNHSESEVE